MKAGSSSDSNAGSLFSSVLRVGLGTSRRRSTATSSMMSGGTLVSCLKKAVVKAFSQTVLISRAMPRVTIDSFDRFIGEKLAPIHVGARKMQPVPYIAACLFQVQWFKL